MEATVFSSFSKLKPRVLPSKPLTLHAFVGPNSASIWISSHFFAILEQRRPVGDRVTPVPALPMAGRGA
jgi:hypothetical protein